MGREQKGGRSGVGEGNGNACYAGYSRFVGYVFLSSSFKFDELRVSEAKPEHINGF